MEKINKRGTLIHGVAASEHLDSSGERIIVKGMDISSLERGEGVLNWEHKNENASHIVGKIIKAKKIFSEADCEDQHQLYFWNKSKIPFVYIVGELFDGVGHQQAKEIAAMVKYDSLARSEGTAKKNTIHFSVEGAKLEKQGSDIVKSIARKVTCTIVPCNKAAIAEELLKPESKAQEPDNLIDKMFKHEENEEVQILEKFEYSQFKTKGDDVWTHKGWNFSETNHPKTPEGHKAYSIFHKETGKKDVVFAKNPHEVGALLDKEHQKQQKEINKNLNVAPSALVGTQALAKENLVGKKKKLDAVKKIKKSVDEAFYLWPTSNQLVKFIEHKRPDLSKSEVVALAKMIAWKKTQKAEDALKALTASEDEVKKARPMPNLSAYGAKGRSELEHIPVQTKRQAEIAGKVIEQMGRRQGVHPAIMERYNFPKRVKEMISPYSSRMGENVGIRSESVSVVKPDKGFTAAHEGFHKVLGDIKHRHGENEYNKIKEVMLSQIHPDDRAMMNLKIMAHGYNPKDPNFDEEVLAHIHTFLSQGEGKGPGERKFEKEEAMDRIFGPSGVIKQSIIQNRSTGKPANLKLADELESLHSQAKNFNQARLSSSWNRAVAWANAQKPSSKQPAESEEQQKLAASELEKSKNVRERKRELFGTDPNAPRISDRRMRMMQQIRDYAQRKYKMPLVTGSGKRDESGKLKETKEIEQEPYDVFTPEGLKEETKRIKKIKEINAKKLEPFQNKLQQIENETKEIINLHGKKPTNLTAQKKLKELKQQKKAINKEAGVIERTDPKPDWRSGNLETQPSPDAAVHELAHLILAPEQTTLPEFQTEMDRKWGESQSKYGHQQQKRTQGEIQPMALENPIRREMGLPANRTTKPVSQQQYAHDDPEQPRFVEGKDPKGKKAFYDRQSRLQTPETRERMEQVREGSLKFNPETGWEKASDVNALINLRGRGKFEEAINRIKEKNAQKFQRLAASEEKVCEPTHEGDEVETLKKPYRSEAQRRWAHTPAGTKALGGKEAVKEWDTASRGKELPEKIEKKDKPFHGYNPKKHSKTGGLSDKYRKKVNREEGSNLKRPVTGKVKPGSKAAKRRKSFCARMKGVKGPTSKDGKLTPKGAALKRWKCS